MPERRLPQLPAVPLRWRTTLVVALIVVTAAALVLTTIVATPQLNPQPVDFSTFGRPGGDILTGHWGHVFANPIIQAGALELAFWGVPFLIGIESVAGWIAFGIIVGILFAVALAAVAERFLRSLTPTWSIPLAVGIAAVAALTGQLTTATSSGHPAEIVVPLLWLIAAGLARRGSPLAAAAVLGASAGWELWGLIGVPVLLLAPRLDLRTIWRSAVGGILVVAALFVPFALLGPVHMFSFSWPVYDNTLAHLVLPDAATFPWPLRLAQGVLAVGGGAAAALLSRRRPDAIWLVPLVVCTVRLFTDPVLAGYYAMPPIIMVLLGMAFAIAQRTIVEFVACLIIFNLLIDTQLSVVSGGILVVMAVLTTVAVVRRGRRTTPRRQVVREEPARRL